MSSPARPTLEPVTPSWPWLTLALTSALYFLSDNEADNDLWIHLLTGLEILSARALPTVDTWSFTSGGAAWVDHEWLSQVMFALVFELAGDTGLWLLKSFTGLATAALLWGMVCRQTDIAWMRAAALIITLAVMARGFAARPQIFTYLATAVLLFWLDRRDATAARAQARLAEIVGIGALFAFWANAHGGFVFGLGLLALYAALPPWQGWPARLALFIAAAGATCLNPYGLSLWTYIAHELRTEHPITEWQAATPSDPALFSYFALLAALLATLPFARVLRARLWHAALIGTAIVLSLRHQRHAPLLALCAIVPLADQIAGGFEWLRRRTTFALSAASVGLIGLSVATVAVLQLGLTAARLAGDGPQMVYDARDYPVGAMEYVRNQNLRGDVAVPLDWGGYVLWHGRPDLRVSLDGRFATVYPPAAVTATFAFFGDGPAADAQRLLDQYGATMVLAPAGWRTPAHDRPEWTVRYRDDVAELLVRESGTGITKGRAPVGRRQFP